MASVVCEVIPNRIAVIGRMEQAWGRDGEKRAAVVDSGRSETGAFGVGVLTT